MYAKLIQRCPFCTNKQIQKTPYINPKVPAGVSYKCLFCKLPFIRTLDNRFFFTKTAEEFLPNDVMPDILKLQANEYFYSVTNWLTKEYVYVKAFNREHALQLLKWPDHSQIWVLPLRKGEIETEQIKINTNEPVVTKPVSEKSLAGQLQEAYINYIKTHPKEVNKESILSLIINVVKKHHKEKGKKERPTGWYVNYAKFHLSMLKRKVVIQNGI